MMVAGEVLARAGSHRSQDALGAIVHQLNASNAFPRRIALVGTFWPRKCGIATFCADVFEQLGKFHPNISVDVYAVDDPLSPLAYGSGATTVSQDDPEAYKRAALRINESGVDAVWLQHEYGIFGGADGEMVCAFVDALAPPLILTPHTVLSAPSERQHQILSHLVERASRIMVMSPYSRDLLAERYGVPQALLQIIPHGAPDRPFKSSEQSKQQQGLAGKKVLMTFGLLSPGKGLERVIEAMPAIVSQHPNTVYRIVGATHPNLVAREGEAYRKRLEALAEELKIADHILWENRFLETEELLDQLQACDIYITPYFNLQQSTSGTLSYAVALGKAVVSTPYLHALDLLAEGAGQLIEANSSAAVAEAVIALLNDEPMLLELQRRAYGKGRETIWPRFAESSAALIESVIAPQSFESSYSIRPNLAGVFAMSDSTGILQHSIGIVPDRRHGYCLDDNARALMLLNVATGIAPEERNRWSTIFASFVQHAWNEERQGFRNFMNFDRTWCEELGSEDSNGRAFWALGQTVDKAPDIKLREWARRWYDTALPHCAQFRSPRTVAFSMLGASAVLRGDRDHDASRDLLERGGDYLRKSLMEARAPGWTWFENVLAYDNPRLSQAMLEAGRTLERPEFIDVGLETLDWLASRQTATAGHFRPIGSESFGTEQHYLPFDQQPLEAQATIEAARSANLATGQPRWLEHGETAWKWFFAANDRQVMVGDLVNGRCFDGINPRGVNQNCGAESVLAFHLAHHAMRDLAAARRHAPEALDQ